MSSLFVLLLLVVAFVGSHLLLATPPLRRPLRTKLGHFWFSLLYSCVAWISFAALVWYYGNHLHDGPAAFGLATVAPLRWCAIACNAVGLLLVGAILAPTGYADSPMALFTSHTREPYGLERVTRHPMFVAVGLLSVGHILLATSWHTVVLFGGFLLLSIVGAWHQDRKLRVSKGPAYQRFLAQTSGLPFAAMIDGRQRLVWRELPWPFLTAGAVGVWIAYRLHSVPAVYTTGVVIALLVVGPIGLVTLSWYRNDRKKG